MNRFADIVNEVAKDIEIEEEPHEIELVSTLSHLDGLCATYSRIATDKETFAKVIEWIDELVQNKWMGQIGKALKDVDSHWNRVVYFQSIGDSELDEMVKDTVSDRNGNVFLAVQRLLWENGHGTLVLGTSLRGKPDIEDENILLALRDCQTLVRNMKTIKYGELENAYSKILKCLPAKLSRDLKTPMQKATFIDNLLDEFEKGNLGCAFNVKSYRPPKECGVLIPQTLTSKDWIAESVCALVRSEYGNDVLICFQSSDVMDVRRASESKYILVDEDENSPYHISMNPALWCDDDEEMDDGSNVWAWRKIQVTVKDKVRAELLDVEHVNPLDREKIKLSILRKAAVEFVKDSDPIEWNEKLCLGVLPDTIHKVTGYQYALRFFKRGLSKTTQVYENPTFIHVVSNAVAHEIGSSEFKHIMLSDLNSIVLFPHALWQVSNFSRSVRNGTTKLYASTIGMERMPGDSNPLSAYMAFWGMSHIREMFRCFSLSKDYSYDDHSVKLMETLMIKGSYPNLLAATRNRTQERVKVLALLSKVFPGQMVGAIVPPYSTKVGKQSKDEFMKNVGFSRGIDLYGNVDTITKPNYDSKRSGLAEFMNKDVSKSTNTSTFVPGHYTGFPAKSYSPSAPSDIDYDPHDKEAYYDRVSEQDDVTADMYETIDEFFGE